MTVLEVVSVHPDPVQSMLETLLPRVNATEVSIVEFKQVRGDIMSRQIGEV